MSQYICTMTHSYVGDNDYGRGVIVVSIVSGGGEVCIAYTSVLVNLLDPKHVLGYLYEYCLVDYATEACTRFFQ